MHSDVEGGQCPPYIDGCCILPGMQSLNRRQVREVDRRAVAEYGMSGLVLMENAGRGTADVLCSLIDRLTADSDVPGVEKGDRHFATTRRLLEANLDRSEPVPFFNGLCRRLLWQG